MTSSIIEFNMTVKLIANTGDLSVTHLTKLILATYCTVFLSPILYGQTTLFNVFRTNYKPDKVLHYNVQLNSDCSIHSDPFDIFYVQNQERIELSATSRDYYNPKSIDFLGRFSLKYSFKALEEFSGSQARIQVFSFRAQNGYCDAWAFAEFRGQIYALESFDLKMKLIFGFPTGMDYGIAHGFETRESGDRNFPYLISERRISLCAYGNCPTQLTDL